MTKLSINRASVIVMAALAFAVSAGCSSKLETGYEPRKLGASDEARRGYYADPFSPEAKAARDYERQYGETFHGSSRKPGY